MTRFLFCSGSGGVVTGESQENHETQQHRESGRQHAEHTSGTVSVVKITAIGGVAPHDQHRRDSDRSHGDDDENSDEDIHRTCIRACLHAT